MILCDSNVLIELFKGNKNTLETLKSIGSKNIGISAVSLMELFFGARNKQELALIKDNLSMHHIFQINKNTSEIAVDLIYKYSKSHGLDIPDALIAATALDHQITLFTYNIKDFKFIENINLYRFE
ncbi:MAG TPA: type II toxin-antitoxin system VapC family toxin [Candidatus Cloacimonadota bacterium]|nr:type II toxin-antitoxin system VapC family toxin [Candidatus Cloacimonadota bacterium]